MSVEEDGAQPSVSLRSYFTRPHQNTPQDKDGQPCVVTPSLRPVMRRLTLAARIANGIVLEERSRTAGAQRQSRALPTARSHAEMEWYSG